MNILGLHTFAFAPQWEIERIEPHIEQAKEFGVRLIEIPIIRPQRFDARRGRAFADRWGLELACSTSLPASVDVLDLPGDGLDFLTPVLQACGLSSRKVSYLQDLAEHFIANPFDQAEWAQYDDVEVARRLMLIRGIGQWTAEMFLIFFMARPNVLPVDDIGLQRAMSGFYNGGQPISKLKMREIARRWQPWQTVATWYMWRSLDPIPVEY